MEYALTILLYIVIFLVSLSLIRYVFAAIVIVLVSVSGSIYWTVNKLKSIFKSE